MKANLNGTKGKLKSIDNSSITRLFVWAILIWYLH